jgi:hypothetical protein
MNDNPDQELLARISDKIQSAELFTPDDLETFRTKILNYSITTEDLVLYLENKIILDNHAVGGGDE